jgi:hypothetical protein
VRLITFRTINLEFVLMLPDIQLKERRALISGIVAAGVLGLASKQAASQILVGASGGPPISPFFLTPQQFGADPTGNTDSTAAMQAWINAGLGTTASPHGLNYSANIPLYVPPGLYKTSAPLTIRSAYGAWIYGAGRFTSTIQNRAGTSVFVTNGFEGSRVERLALSTTGSTAAVFDLDWDNTGDASLQSNTFADCNIGGGAVGLRIGNGYMGSENLLLNNFFASSTVGLQTCNFNALQQTVIGGDFQSCGTGILVLAGSVNKIDGVGFQLNSTCDIKVQNSANDTMTIIGCRSESVNFGIFGNSPHIYMCGVSHENASNGSLADVSAGGPITIERCVTIGGQLFVNGARARAKVTGSSFGRSDWVNTTTMTGTAAVEIEDLMYGGTPNGTPGTIIQRARISAAGTQNYALS